MGRYILSRQQSESLIEYLMQKLPNPNDCDGTMKHTKKWLEENISADMRDAALKEIENNGGYCDCEVIFNCYRD